MERRFESRRGFTLTEVMVVVGIVAILAGIAIPSVIGYLPTYRLNGISHELMADLQSARLYAVRNNGRCVLEFTPVAYNGTTGGKYKGFMDTNRDWKDKDAGGNNEAIVIPEVTMPASVTLYTALFTDNGNGLGSSKWMIGFDSSGVASRANSGAYVSGYILVRNNRSNFRRLYISPAGHVTIKRSSDGAKWE
jgi:prepilin-type N-terminal cleavage/methylation domain-containing protein